MSGAILSAEGVRFGYDSQPPLLRDFSFSLSRGEFSGLIGPSAAGKTTIFRILSGYLRPDSGVVRAGGRDIRAMSGPERARFVGVVPQSLVTHLPYTVRQMVEMGRVSRLPRLGGATRRDAEAVDEAMAMAGADGFSDKLFSNLSGGERQRAVIAMTLAQEPEVLLLDEPTSHLDIGCSSRIMRLLSDLNSRRGLSVVMITHDIQVAASYCSRLTMIKDGVIIADGPPDSVVTPGLISRAYGCDVEITRDGRGRVLLSAE